MIKKTVLCTVLLMASTSLTHAFEEPRAAAAYTQEDKQALAQGIAGVGTLSFCDSSGFYASKVGPVAFERMMVVIRSLGQELGGMAIGIFREAKQDGTIPMFTKGSDEMGSFEATDEAGCRVVEDIVSKLMEPKGLFDVEPTLKPDEQKS